MELCANLVVPCECLVSAPNALSPPIGPGLCSSLRKRKRPVGKSARSAALPAEILVEQSTAAERKRSRSSSELPNSPAPVGRRSAVIVVPRVFHRLIDHERRAVSSLCLRTKRRQTADRAVNNALSCNNYGRILVGTAEK